MTKCLLVEDSEIIRFVAKKILTDLGYDVAEAETAEQGVAICASEHINCVFLDWDLPEMGALDFLQGVAAMEQRNFEIILCATENDPQQFALAKAAGAKFHLLKPFDKLSIRAILHQSGVDGSGVTVEEEPGFKMVDDLPEQRRRS